LSSFTQHVLNLLTPRVTDVNHVFYSTVQELCQPHLAIVDTDGVINSTNFHMCL